MGGLRKYMPWTHRTMAVATYAIAGLPLAAGFFSKDEILAGAWERSFILWLAGAVAAAFTAFYMFRLYFMTFRGEYRGAVVEGIEQSEPEHAGHNLIPDQRHLDEGDEHSDKAHGHHRHAHAPHESPASMTGVLVILAVLSIAGGYIGFPAALGGPHPTWFQNWLEPVLLPVNGHAFHFHEASLGQELTLMAISVAIAFFGFWIARSLYLRRSPLPDAVETRLGGLYHVLSNKYYIDDIYNATAVRGVVVFSTILWWIDAHIIDGLVNLTRHLTVVAFGYGSNLFDNYILDGAVNGVAYSARGGSAMLRRMQSGLVQNYALIMGGGIVLLAVVYLFLKP